MPIGLANIGWKMYMVNASWDIAILALIVSLPMFKSANEPFSRPQRAQMVKSSCLTEVGEAACVPWLTHKQVIFWVETKGKTLEEIDAIFEGEKHSSDGR